VEFNTFKKRVRQFFNFKRRANLKRIKVQVSENTLRPTLEYELRRTTELKVASRIAVLASELYGNPIPGGPREPFPGRPTYFQMR
jgi:hypothetical protein